ncbi:hypothetical protein ETD83_24255 [Actinomadura soli]|uniref:Uncharacterized protein n=1 Tax=Actinomadura soli TaxID=2508997 RepID=A0A5C4J812_9ACTN|nr:hypothetical protein [Actinomadura soli]TMQ94212.1 hypothetical protein ETD83_24255 [Actinomadura soli]
MCEVCGAPLNRRDLPGDEVWNCDGCDALYVRQADGALLRRPFPPADQRWAAAAPAAPAASGGVRVEHAVAYADTLCGIERDAVILLRHFWSAANPRACAECRTVADGRVARWPAETGR